MKRLLLFFALLLAGCAGPYWYRPAGTDPSDEDQCYKEAQRPSSSSYTFGSPYGAPAGQDSGYVLDRTAFNLCMKAKGYRECSERGNVDSCKP